jgi:RNA polymerase sigma-70 factor (ECF subfamily)
LLQLLKQGDREAFATLYDRYWLKLFDQAFKRLANREQSEDIVQNIFVRIWQRRESLDIDDLPAYLFTALRYNLLDYITRIKTATSFYEPFEAMLRESEMPDSVLIAKDFMNLVYSYADTLPDKRKEIFLLHIKNKLSTKEIAAMLGISQKTVQNQLRTAQIGLRPHIATILALLIASH